MPRFFCPILLFLLIGFIYTNSCHARNDRHWVDSLTKAIPKQKTDSDKIVIMCRITEYYIDYVPDSATIMADRVMAFSKKLNWNEGYSRAYNLYGEIANMNGDYPNAIEYLKKSEYFATKAHDLRGLESALINRANSYQYLGQYDSSLPIYLRSKELCKQIQDTDGVGTVDLNLANVYEKLGNYREARKCIDEAYHIYTQLNDKRQIATSLGALGILYNIQNDYASALKYSLKALRIKEEIGIKPDIARNLYNICLIYMDLEEYDKTIDYARRAHLMANEGGDLMLGGVCLEGIGSAYLKQSRFDSATHYYYQALHIYRKYLSEQDEASVTNNLGEAYYRAHNYPMAMAFLQKSLSLNHKVGNLPGEIVNWGAIGLLYLSMASDSASPSNKIYSGHPADMNSRSIHLPANHAQQLRLAVHFLNLSLDSAKAIGAPDVMAESYKLMAKAHSLLGNAKATYSNFNEFLILHDSMFNMQKQNSIVRYEVEYEFKKREDSLKYAQMIKLQARDFKLKQSRLIFWMSLGFFLVVLAGLIYWQRAKLARTRNEQRAAFARQLLEIELKALRAQMNPHFIFNCLNSIQAFIMKEDKMAATEYLHKFARLIRLILDNSQKTSNTIEDEAEILTLYMALERLRMKNKFDFEVHVDDGIDPTFTEIPSMVIQPLVENSIWHGFSQMTSQGKLEVEFKKEPEGIRCVVKDNGIGIEKSQSMKSGSGHISKGMKLIEDRLKAWSQTKGIAYQLQVGLNPDYGHGTQTEIMLLYHANA